ncbi:MAG: hypothetical protein JRI68_17290 [Deltaproteobacteria bacterium]|nr:hypothetical protein [Deltaproteobacteria bacterium]
MTRTTCLATLLAACALTTGCANEYSIEFRYLTHAPPEVIIDSDRMLLPAGIAVGVEAIAVEDGRLIEDFIDFLPVRPGIIGIDRGVQERTFVIYGMTVGATSVDYYFHGELIGNMPAEVTPQDVGQ